MAWTHVGTIDDAAAARRRRAAGAPRARLQRGHDLRHRGGVDRLGAPQSRAGRACRARSERARRHALGRRQSISPRRADRSARRPRTVTAAPTAAPTQEPGLQEPIAAPSRPPRPTDEPGRLPRPSGRRRRRSRHAGLRDRRRSTSGNSSPNIRSRDGRNARHVAGGELAVSRRRGDLVRRLVAGHARVGGRAAGRARGLEGVHRQQLRQRRGRGGGRVDDRHAVADGSRAARPPAAGSGCSPAAACRSSPTAAAGR